MQIEGIHNSSDTPWKFPLQKEIGEYTIRFEDLVEFAQGSPLIGYHTSMIIRLANMTFLMHYS
uniref:Uncharacterized protein n=1 Tax=Prevotella sp. GTC17260 TaxID=3236796 RepID=A0AB33JIR6_9BACT